MTSEINPQKGLQYLRPYIPGTPIEEVEREYGLEEVIKMASNENPRGTSPLALEAIKAALGRLSFYPDAQSYDLRRALADHHDLQPDQVIVGNGVDGIISMLCMAYLEEEREVIVSRSSFPIYDAFVHIMRAKLIKTPMKDYSLDLTAMGEAISERTAMVFICNPNNPTGSIVTAPEVEAFMRDVPDHVLVVFDEAYFELVDSDEFPDTMQFLREERENMIILRTFSKVYGLAGIRLGYGMAMPEVLNPLYQVKEPFGVNLLAQAAGIAALKDDEFLQESISHNHAGRLWLYGEFDRLGLSYVKSHANFVLVHLGPSACDIQQELLKLGVIVRPCSGYDLDDFLRVTVGTPEQNRTFIKALETVLERP